MSSCLVMRDYGKNYPAGNLLFFILVNLLFLNSIFAQSLSNSHFIYHSQKLLYDIGEDWESLTVFEPQRFRKKNQRELMETKPSIKIDGQITLNAKHNSYSLSGFGHFVYKNNYYAYIYPSFIEKVNQNNSIISNKFNNNNLHNFGLGYENNWALLQIGRGRESWGSGTDIQLAISEDSGSYDYLLIGSDYGNIRVRYIYGFLENIDFNINRFITARGFEWTNKKSLIIGFSEIVIYSGKDRLMDIGYLNPMSSHLEIELNNRLNTYGTSNSNAVWQIHLDYLLNKKYRLSFNYLYDEFVIDKHIELGKEHGRAFSIRLAYTPISNQRSLLSLFSSFVHVGTPTFRHKVGTNNFVQSGKPLGWYRGSDGQEFCIGTNYFNNKSLIFSFYSGIFKSGQETITNRIFDSYENYLEGTFPSGQVIKSVFVGTKLIYLFKENYSISSDIYQSENLYTIEFKISAQISRITQ